MNLSLVKKTVSKGVRVGEAEPSTGEARPLSKDALLAVQEELDNLAEWDVTPPRTPSGTAPDLSAK